MTERHTFNAVLLTETHSPPVCDEICVTLPPGNPGATGSFALEGARQAALLEGSPAVVYDTPGITSLRFREPPDLHVARRVASALWQELDGCAGMRIGERRHPADFKEELFRPTECQSPMPPAAKQAHEALGQLRVPPFLEPLLREAAGPLSAKRKNSHHLV